MQTFKSFLKEEVVKYFDMSNIDDWINTIKSGISAPVVNVTKSTLGGAENVTIMITAGLEPKETWINNIFENSRYGRLRLSRDGTLEMFQASYKTGKKMRKCKIKSPEAVVKKINEWISTVSLPKES